MARWLLNVALLSGKELRSLMRDVTLMALIVFAFTLAIYTVAHGIKAEVSNASVAILDGDHSELSRRLRHAIRPPYFRTPVDVARADVAPGLDHGKYIFVVEIPPHFEADVLAGRAPAVQVLVDATAMTQAGLGTADLLDMFETEVLDFIDTGNLAAGVRNRVNLRLRYNPNGESSWFTAIMQIVTDLTVLAIILVGAAVIREREHGTIEHLLVMPVRASEIATAKILANGSVILVAALSSVWLVAHCALGVPLAGSGWLFALGTFFYLFSVTSLGMWLATLAPSMPQFGLLAVPVYAISYLLSGAATPVQSMPVALQLVVPFLPNTEFVAFTQAILYRGAGLSAVWLQLVGICTSGAVFLALALAQFRSMLERQS